MKLIVLMALVVTLCRCGGSSNNPYEGAVELPVGTTFICRYTTAEQQAILTSPDYEPTGREKLQKFAGAVYCQDGAIYFTPDRYTNPYTISAGSHSKAETGLACSFDVDSSCNVSNKTF